MIPKAQDLDAADPKTVRILAERPWHRRSEDRWRVESSGPSTPQARTQSTSNPEPVELPVRRPPAPRIPDPQHLELEAVGISKSRPSAPPIRRPTVPSGPILQHREPCSSVRALVTDHPKGKKNLLKPRLTRIQKAGDPKTTCSSNPSSPGPRKPTPEDHQPLEPVVARAEKKSARRRPTAQTRDGPSPRRSPPEDDQPLKLETGSSKPPPRKAPASRIRDPRSRHPERHRYLGSRTRRHRQPEGSWWVGSSKDLCDTQSFKELKEPASFARSALLRRAVGASESTV